MTCVVGLVQDGIVWMGGDSIGVDGFSHYTVAHHDKVFMCEKSGLKFLFAISGSFRIRDLLQYAFNPPDYDPRTTLDQYMKTVFVDELVRCFKTHDFIHSENGTIGVARSSGLLIGTQGHLYELNSDFSMLECPPYGCASGSGYQTANAALYALQSFVRDPAQRIRLALQTTEAMIATVRGPFTVLSLPLDKKGKK